MAPLCLQWLAAFVLALQFAAAVVSLSSTAFLISHYNKGDDSVVDTNTSSHIRWPQAWIPLSAVWYTAFSAVWLVSIVLAGLSFCFRNNITVAANILTLMVGMVFDLLVFGVSLGYILTIDSSTRTATIGRITIIYNMGLMVLVLIIMIVSLTVISCYSSRLQKDIIQDQYNEDIKTAVAQSNLVPAEPIKPPLAEPAYTVKPTDAQQIQKGKIPIQEQNLNRFYESEIINPG